MDDLDRMLGRLAQVRIDPRVADLTPLVMTQVSRRRDAAVARRSMAMAAGLAFAIGVAGSLWPGASLRAEPVGVSAFAPSLLLGE